MPPVVAPRQERATALNYASRMISTHPSPSAAADALAARIEACFDCTQPNPHGLRGRLQALRRRV